MNGSIYPYTKKGKTFYYVSYRVDDPITGKKVQKTKRGFETKKAAKEFLNEIQHNIMYGTYVSPKILTLGEYLKEWLTTYVESNLEQTTKDSYKRLIYSHIIPYIGSIPIQKLRGMHLNNFYTEKLKNGRLNGEGPLSARTVYYMHRILSEALKHAVMNQLIPVNVANNATPPRVKKYKGSIYTSHELIQLFNIVKDTDMEVPILLASLLGLRRGEILGISWEQVDFNNKTININRQLVKTDNGPIFSTPKTENSNRIIPISENIIKILKTHRKKQFELKLLLGSDYEDNNLVVCRQNGKMITPDSFTHKFSKLLKRNKLKKIRFHDLRHSYATLMLEQGQSLKVTSELLGHSTVATTGDIYSHVLPDIKRKASETIDKAIFGN